MHTGDVYIIFVFLSLSDVGTGTYLVNPITFITFHTKKVLAVLSKPHGRWHKKRYPD